MGHRRRWLFTRELKLEVIRLAALDGRPKAQVARQLGIRVNQPRKWRQEFELENARSNATPPPVATDDVEQLRLDRFLRPTGLRRSGFVFDAQVVWRASRKEVRKNLR